MNIPEGIVPIPLPTDSCEAKLARLKAREQNRALAKRELLVKILKYDNKTKRSDEDLVSE